MGQHSKWLSQHLSQSISNSSESISNNYNYASNNNFNSSYIPNGYVNGIVAHTIYNNKTVVSSASSKDGHETIDTFPNQIFQSFAQQQIHNFSESIVEHLSDAMQLALTSEQRLNGTTTSTLTSNANEKNTADNGDDYTIGSNYLMVLLIVLYAVIVIGGVFGNASLIITLYTQSSARLRNPLLVALCLADLMVTGVSAPLTIVTLMLMARNAITSAIVCKLIYFVQVSFLFEFTIYIYPFTSFGIFDIFFIFFSHFALIFRFATGLLVAFSFFHLAMKAKFLGFHFIYYSKRMQYKRFHTFPGFIPTMAFRMEKLMPLIIIIIVSNKNKYIQPSCWKFGMLTVVCWRHLFVNVQWDLHLDCFQPRWIHYESIHLNDCYSDGRHSNNKSSHSYELKKKYFQSLPCRLVRLYRKLIESMISSHCRHTNRINYIYLKFITLDVELGPKLQEPLSDILIWAFNFKMNCKISNQSNIPWNLKLHFH